jgi:hypothetical protein
MPPLVSSLFLARSFAPRFFLSLLPSATPGSRSASRRLLYFDQEERPTSPLARDRPGSRAQVERTTSVRFAAAAGGSGEGVHEGGEFPQAARPISGASLIGRRSSGR